MMRMLHFGGMGVVATPSRVENATNDIGNLHGDYELEDLSDVLPKLSLEATFAAGIKPTTL